VWILTSLLGALSFGTGTLLFKVNSLRRGPWGAFLSGLYLSGALGFAAVLSQERGWAVSLALVSAGAIVGVGSAGGNWLFSKALALGPISLTSPLVNLYTVYVVLLAVFIYGERLTALEIVCIGLLFLSVSLLPVDPSESLSIRSRRWYPIVALAGLVYALRNGGLKVVQEMGLSDTAVLFYAYLASFLWFMGQSLGEKGPQASSSARRLGLLAGFFSFGGMQLYAYSLRSGPASLVAPLFSANSLVVAVLSILLLGERLSRLQIVAILLFLIALVLLKAQ